MDPVIHAIASTGNVAILVLVLVAGALYKMFREERKLDRDARREDALQCAASTDRQTAAVAELARVLNEVRLDAARKRNVRSD